MAYIVGIDRNQTRMVTTSLDALIDEDNSVRVIDFLRANKRCWHKKSPTR